MAFINLLKAAYTKKLGETYGVTWKGKAVIRSVPFSKAPLSELQKKNVRAFEALNRLSAAIARTGFARTGIAASGMHNHNAVAKFLKPVIKNHIFEPQNIVEKIPKSEQVFITQMAHNRTLNTLSLGVGFGSSFLPVLGQSLFLLFFDSYGQVYFSRLLLAEDFSFTFPFDFWPDREYYSIAFLSNPSGKSYFLSDFAFMEGLKMQYSLDEQPTGDVHIGGLPIYCKTYAVEIMTDTERYNEIVLDSNLNWSRITKHEISLTNIYGPQCINTSSNFPVKDIGVKNPWEIDKYTGFSITLDKENKNLVVGVYTQTSSLNYTGYITFWYTKQS